MSLDASPKAMHSLGLMPKILQHRSMPLCLPLSIISLTETPLLVTAYFNPSVLSNSFGNELKALPLDGTK